MIEDKSCSYVEFDVSFVLADQILIICVFYDLRLPVHYSWIIIILKIKALSWYAMCL